MPGCPSLIELEAYLDVGSEVGIGPHLADCDACRQRLEELRRNQAFLAECRDVQKPSSQATTPSGYPDAPAGYHLVRVVGRGGQAVVYEAIQLSTQRRVALKVVRLGTRDAARRRRRFEREIELVSSLRHPSIVTVFDSGITPDGDPYLVMELVAGDPIAHRPGAALEDRLRQFQQVCSAIRYAHQHGVVHRDIKPSNILVDQNGLPRVLDFGLATTVEARDALTLTRSGEFLGTPIYAAPEQLRGSAVAADMRTDVYSLGLVLYELLTGGHPFSPSSALADIVTGILERDPDRPSSRSDGLNHEIDTIVLKALAKEPQRRYPTVDALESDIARYLRGEPIEAKRDSTWYTLRKTARRHRWAVAGIAAFLLLLIAFGVVMAVLYRSARETSRELQQALATRDLDRAIELGRSGDLTSAEPMLWDQYLTDTTSPDQIRDWARGPLLHRRAHWALWELYQRQPCIRTTHLFSGQPWEVTFLDGGQVVAADVDLTIHHWDAHAGSHTRMQPPRADGTLLAVRFLRRPLRMVAAYDQRLQVFELAPLRRVLDVSVPPGATIRNWGEPAYDQGQLTLVSGHKDGSVRLWNVEDGSCGPPIQTAFTDIAWTHLTGNGQLWSRGESPRRFEMLELRTGRRHHSADLSTDSWLAVDAEGRVIHSRRIWNGFSEIGAVELEDQPLARVYSYSFSPSGRRLLGRGASSPVWDADTGDLVRVIAARDASRSAVSLDDRLMATTHGDGTIRAWEIRADLGQRVIPVVGTSHSVRFSPTGQAFVIAGSTDEDGPVLRVGRIDSQRELQTLVTDLHVETISAVAWRDEDRLLTGGHEGNLVAWRRVGNQWEPRLVAALGTVINEIAPSADRNRFALACDDGTVRIWDDHLETPAIVGRHALRVPTIAHTPGGVPVTGSRDGDVVIWEAGGARSLLSGGRTVRVVRCLADPPRIAASGDDQTVHVWNGDGDLLYEIANGVRVFAMALSPDGTLLATGDASGAVRLWDLPTGTPLARLVGHEHMIFSLDFSPDGHGLITGGPDGTVRIWDLRYFDRHIAGNFEHQRQRRGTQAGKPARQ